MGQGVQDLIACVPLVAQLLCHLDHFLDVSAVYNPSQDVLSEMLGDGQHLSRNETEFLETLQTIDGLSEITFLQQNLNLLLIKLNFFLIADIPQFLQLGLEGNRFEPEFNAPGNDGFDNSA